jgi:hypothetical protein
MSRRLSTIIGVGRFQGVARNAFKYRPAQVAWRCDRADKFILEINEIANQQYCRVFQRAKKRKAGDAFLKIWGFNHVWLTQSVEKPSAFVKYLPDKKGLLLRG